jgi:hypothetical protein
MQLLERLAEKIPRMLLPMGGFQEKKKLVRQRSKVMTETFSIKMLQAHSH